MAMDADLTTIRYKQILDDVQSCNCIRYAAYRTAAKLGVLQKGLAFDRVGLTVIRRVFEQHRILSTDLYLSLDDSELEAILYDVFFATSKTLTRSFDVNLSVSLTKLFLSNIYEPSQSSDNDDKKKMSVLEAKVGIVLLCRAPLQAKYQYWFTELSDHNVRLSRRRLSLLLNALLSVTNFLSEQNTFSENLLQPTLDSCFNNAFTSLGINESDFLSWVYQEPQILVWHSTFYRLYSSENVTHHVHCAVCGMYPIVGLRYHCLRCLRYSLCQVCFFTGRTSKRHKTNHIIREYCSKTSTYETTVAFLRGFINRLCGNKSRLQYLPVYQPQNFNKKNVDEDEHSNKQIYENCNYFTETAVTSVHTTNPELELDKIISQIELEFRLVQDAVDKGSTTNIIHHHAVFLQQHLDRLKALQSYLKHGARITSTPMRGLSTTEAELSPIRLLTDGPSFDACGTLDVLTPPFSSPSGFSTWVEEAGGLKRGDDSGSYAQQLEKELDVVMEKLNKMLETSFTPLTKMKDDEEKDMALTIG